MPDIYTERGRRDGSYSTVFNILSLIVLTIQVKKNKKIISWKTVALTQRAFIGVLSYCVKK